MDWTDEFIDRLRALWREGHSTAEIGRRLGISKNAVVGKAHRLALDARPSPIRRSAPGQAPKRETARRVTGPTLPPMAAVAPVERVVPLAVAPLAVPQPPVLRAVGRSSGRLVACCWPIGEPGTQSFRFCDDESLPGKPYCSAHAAVAYVKVRDRRDDAA